jgi:hypothetical protein
MKILRDIFHWRARPSLGVMHRYIKYNFKKKKEVSRAAGPLCSPRRTTLRHWVLPVHSCLGSTLAVGSDPSSLGPTLRRWVLPSPLGFTPSSLGLTLHRWALPFVVGPYPLSLCFTPFAVGFTPLPFGISLRCWVLPPEGSGCDHLHVVRRRWV